MKKVRDSQRSKVYQWESNNIPNIHAIELTLCECELLIAESISWWFRLSTHQPSKAERDKGIQLMPIIKNGRGIRKAKGNASKITPYHDGLGPKPLFYMKPPIASLTEWVNTKKMAVTALTS